VSVAAASLLLLTAIADFGAVSAAPRGVFDCKITLGEHEGQTIRVSNTPDGMSIVDGGRFVSRTEVLSSKPIHRVVDGLVVDGALIEAAGEAGRYTFSLDRVVGAKEGPISRIWIMKAAGASQPSWTGQNYIVAEIWGFAAVGRCAEVQGNLKK
jgi:hypothetical protein